MTINQQAIELLEKNEYEEALRLFQKAVYESRNVQSLTNLAWIYCYEEADDMKAIELLEEAIDLKSTSHVPYNLLGEIYCRQEKWKDAKDRLLQSISISPSKTAYTNLGVAHYHLGNITDASTYFLLASDKSDYALYSHVKCLIELGNKKDAKLTLDTFCEHDEEFVDAVELADLYVELGCFKEAIIWFEKGWEDYSKQPDWISRYIYSMLKLINTTRSHERINEVIAQKIEEMKEAYEEECDEDWSENDKEDYINELLDDKKEYEQMVEQISSGYIPVMKFETSIETACYLFGCTRHNHAEYQQS